MFGLFQPDRLGRADAKLKQQCIIPDLDGPLVKLFVLTELENSIDSHLNHMLSF